ncbi:hypothetical protein SLS62_005668 [Diatrype stigma]|uniref:2EXR domain-containing protein n=1 Tax=Diatrype stigma TaxID=117547 RepID=A0AAN9US62_9PEZI
MTAAPARTSFWLEFRVFDDGLDAPAAQRMAARSICGGGGGGESGSSSFALFPQLPAELRLKIWEYLLAPRIVQVACFDSEQEPESEFESASASPCQEAEAEGKEGEGQGQGGVSTYFSSFSSSVAATAARERRHVGGSGGGKGRRRERWQSQQQVPVLLHVNRETRTLALKHYELAFAWKVPHVLAVNSLVPGTYYYPQNHFPPSSSSSSSVSTTANNTTSPSLSSPPSTSSPSVPSQKQPQQPSPKPSRRAAAGSEARVYFSFARDMLYLRGELEPHDSFGFNSPMAYFVARGDAARVRRVAVAFRALGYGETGSQQIFGSLFHVVDRFGQGPPPPPAPLPAAGAGIAGAQEVGYHGHHHHHHHHPRRDQDPDRDQGQQSTNKYHKNHGLIGGRVLVAVDPADEHTHALMGGEGPLVPSSPSPSASSFLSSATQSQGLNNNNAIGAVTSKTGRDAGDEGGEVQREEREGAGQEKEEEPNVVQKIWRDWYRGSIVTSSLAKMKFTLVREEDLGRYL